MPVSIEDVKIPLLFRPIQSVRLIHWEGDSNHPQSLKLITDLTPILGLSPLKAKEAEQLRAEEEKRHREQELERKAEKERLEIEAEIKRKAEEERKWKEIEEQRKIEEENQREEERQKRLKAGRRDEEIHEHKDAEPSQREVSLAPKRLLSVMEVRQNFIKLSNHRILLK